MSSYVLFSSDSSPESPDVTLLFLSHSPFSFALSHLMWYSQSLAHSRGTKTSGENSEIILRLVLDLIKLKTLLTGPKKHIHLQASCFLILLFSEECVKENDLLPLDIVIVELLSCAQLL